MADCSTEEATQAIHELGESDFRLDHHPAGVARISTALATSQARVAELEKTLTREGSKRALVKADLLEAHEALAELRSQWPKMMDIIADKDKRIAELEADREHLLQDARSCPAYGHHIKAERERRAKR